MAVAIPLRDPGKLVAHEVDGAEPFGVYIAVALLTEDQLGDRRAGVHEIHVEPVLVPVEGHHRQLLRVGRKGDAGNITIRVGGEFHGAGSAGGDVEHAAFHRGVGLTWLGVLETAHAGVKLPVVGLEGELLHGRLVGTHKGEQLAVGRELHQPRHGKLLLVDPVGGTIDHAVEHPVVGHLRLRVEVELGEEDVVIYHVGQHPAVG